LEESRDRTISGMEIARMMVDQDFSGNPEAVKKKHNYISTAIRRVKEKLKLPLLRLMEEDNR